MRTILNTKNIDSLKNPIFLGEPLALARTDKIKYPQFNDLYDKQMQLFWRPNEIELTKDRVDYQSMEKHEKFIFTSNLLYQTMMDSVIARGADSLIQYVTNPELEFAMKVWVFFETIHERSYNYIIENVYPDPSAVFDRALEDPEITKRAISTKEYYDDLNSAYSMGLELTHFQIRELIYQTLISVNILEAVRFYVSFVCSFAFGENKKMNGNAEIIKLIRRDEAMHYRLSQNVISVLHAHPDEGFSEVVKHNRDKAIDMFLHAAKEEKAWAEYIFSQGSIRGLNAKILGDYIEWLTDSRMEALGFPKYFGTKNPIGGWLEPWMNSSSVQVAPQEHEITSYRISASKQDMGDMNFEGLL